MMKTNPAAVLSIALLSAAFAVACSDETSSTSTSGRGGSGGMESSSSSSSSTSSSSSGQGGGGAGGAGGDGGMGGAGGDGGMGGAGGSMARGHAATETVSGGKYMSTSKYRMIYTIGQPSQIQSTVQSQKYRMQGGIVGATGSLK